MDRQILRVDRRVLQGDRQINRRVLRVDKGILRVLRAVRRVLPIIRRVLLSKSGMARGSRPEGFCKKGVLKNFTKFTGKHLCQSLFFNEVAGVAV